MRTDKKRLKGREQEVKVTVYYDRLYHLITGRGIL